MGRGGVKKHRDEPERRCIATGESGSKSGLIRFVVGPGEMIVPDLAEKLPGRGIWVSADHAALTKAASKGLFARGAKRAVKVPPELVEMVEKLLTDRVAELLALARKAGQAISGAQKVKEALASGDAVCLMQANDGSEREKARMRPPDGEKTHFEVLTGQEMGLAFGRDRVIHAALIAGGLSDLVRYESARLAAVRKNQA